MMSDNKRVTDLLELIQSYYFKKGLYRLWISLWKEKIKNDPELVATQVAYLLGEKEILKLGGGPTFKKWHAWSTQTEIPWLAELASIKIEATYETLRAEDKRLENESEWEEWIDSHSLSNKSKEELLDMGKVRDKCTYHRSGSEVWYHCEEEDCAYPKCFQSFLIFDFD